MEFGLELGRQLLPLNADPVITKALPGNINTSVSGTELVSSAAL